MKTTGGKYAKALVRERRNKVCDMAWHGPVCLLPTWILRTPHCSKRVTPVLWFLAVTEFVLMIHDMFTSSKRRV